MAEIAVKLAIDQLLPLLKKEVKLLKGVHKEFIDIKDELESIQAFLKDADRRAAAVDGDNTDEGVKTWVKQLTKASFRIEDIIDNYMMYVGQQPRNPGCAALINNYKTLKQRHQIASEIQDIKSLVSGIKERSGRYGFHRSLNQGSRDSRGSQNDKWHDPRVAALYIEEADVVGFEAPKKILIDWMVKGLKPTVISVVGMGGQGKTTLAKIVFDNKDIIGHFDCHVFITVSQSYTVEGLLRNMLEKLYKENDEDPPRSIYEKDQESMLTDELKNYLRNKRYVIVFDDVWNEHFWDDVEFALIDNKNGSKILITTRNANVLVSCRRSSFIVETHELQRLDKKQSRELFNKKAFKIDNDSKKLNDIAYEIVEQCNGLPLAIVTIGGLLSTREKNVSEWEQFRDNLSSALKNDTHLIGIKKNLSLSYDDLPYYLKACLLYFGIYPKVYEVKSKRVIRQWIAEGFVKEEKGKTLEEVAEGYLIELIHRSLVQVSSVKIDGKIKGCRVHDQIRDMILEKFEDFNFCKPISEYGGQSSSVGIIRHLSISTTSVYLMDRIESSHVRSLHVFQNDQDEYVCCEPTIPEKFKLLKVLDFESAPTLNVPINLGDLIHLKYLSFRSSNHVPKSIGMFQNLETSNVGNAYTCELPKEISKLTKLRHLIGFRLSLIQLKDGIGKMTSLQTLCSVDLGKGGAEVIKELGKLKQIRDLVLVNVHAEDVSFLSSSINEMKRIEKLHVSSIDIHEVVDLNLISPLTKLRKLRLHGNLQKLPKWILELQNLLVLKLLKSMLTEDLMESLQSLQHSLLILYIGDDAYQGSHLHFQNGRFQKLKELYVGLGHGDINIVIDKGALPSLQKLHLEKNIPTGIQHLEKLEVLYISRMEAEFVQHSSATEDWNWIIDHVPNLEIHTTDGEVIRNTDLIKHLNSFQHFLSYFSSYPHLSHSLIFFSLFCVILFFHVFFYK